LKPLIVSWNRILNNRQQGRKVKPMKFLVIGGDAEGMGAASRVKRNKPDLEVTVLEKSMDVSYSACGMPYYIHGHPGSGDI
jgi:hypothetical protein